MGWTAAVPTNIKYSSGQVAGTVNDIAMTGDDQGNLYVGFVGNQTNNQLFIARYSGGVWSQATPTGQTSNWGPALAWYDNQPYMLWNAGNSQIFYGKLGATGFVNLGPVQNPSGSSVAKTNSGPAGIAWNGSLWCGHLGWGQSIKLYEDSFAAGQWGTDAQVTNQSGTVSPGYAATTGYQFLFHKGSSFNAAGLYWSAKSPTSPGYSSNAPIPQLQVAPTGANRSFGAASFGDNQIVAVSTSGSMDWASCAIGNNFTWTYQGGCGATSSSTNAGAGMWFIASQMVMVFAGSNNELSMTTLDSIP